MDLEALGERSIILDCDVLQADGGTRTRGHHGAYIALSIALRKLVKFGSYQEIARCAITWPPPASASSAACRMLDLCYQEDSQAEVDMNIVMTGSGRFVEVQATAEKTPFDDEQLAALLALARQGIAELVAIQRTFERIDRLLRHLQPRQAARVSTGRSGFRRAGAAGHGRSAGRDTARRSKKTPSRKPSTTGSIVDGYLFADDSGLEVDALGGAPGVLFGALRGRARDGRSEQRAAARTSARRRPIAPRASFA